MDSKILKAEHPELVAEIEATAHAAGRAEGEAAGRVAGAAAELERIRGVEAQALPGHEKLIAVLKFDGKTTGAEAAIQVVNAERAKLGNHLAALTDDAAGAGKAPATGAPPVPKTAKEEVFATIEEKAKAEWTADAKIRGEFTDLAAYTAFRRAEDSGRLRLVSRAS